MRPLLIAAPKLWFRFAPPPGFTAPHSPQPTAPHSPQRQPQAWFSKVGPQPPTLGEPQLRRRSSGTNKNEAVWPHITKAKTTSI